MKKIYDWTEGDWRVARLLASMIAGGIAALTVALFHRMLNETGTIGYQVGYEGARLENMAHGTDQGSQGRETPAQAGSTKCAETHHQAGDLGADNPAAAERTDAGRETSLGSGAAGDLPR